MPAFDNDRATDEQREAHLDSVNAYVENHGDDNEPEWLLFYNDTRQHGRRRCQNLDALTYADAIFEACEIV